MSKFSGEKRYADILTVLLVIVIIGIIALLGYFGYKAIKKSSVENAASDAVQEFYDNLKDTNQTSEENNVSNEENTAEEPSGASLEDFNTNTTTSGTSDTGSSSTKARKKTYLGDYEVKGTIKIPKTGIEYPVLSTATVGSLSKAVGILDIAKCSEISSKVTELNIPGTNALILGHNYRNGQFFSDNDKLTNGDEIQITDTLGETVTYTIYNMYYTDPDDTDFMVRSLDSNTREITLQTCNNDSSQRLIIWAKDM